MKNINGLSDYIIKINKQTLIMFGVLYLAFIVDILLFQIREWSDGSLAQNEIKIKRSIFVVQTFSFENTDSSKIISLGPSHIGYLVLFILPLLSMIVISVSNKKVSLGKSLRNSNHSVITIFFILIDAIIILLFEIKLNYFGNNYGNFLWMEFVDFYLSIILIAILIFLFTLITFIIRFKSINIRFIVNQRIDIAGFIKREFLHLGLINRLMIV